MAWLRLFCVYSLFAMTCVYLVAGIVFTAIIAYAGACFGIGTLFKDWLG